MGVVLSLVSKFLDRALRFPIPDQHLIKAAERPISRILVIGKFPNPTFDYYFAARFAAPGMPGFKLIDTRGFDESLEAEDAFVIIIRYASRAVVRWIKDNRAALAGVVFFVDDDIAAAITSIHAPIRYRYRLFTQSILPLRLLDGLIDDLWVSTDVLADRLAYASPRVVKPAPDLRDIQRAISIRPPRNSAWVTVAYHATAIHHEEHRFLVPIITSVLGRRPTVRFEVVAAGKSAEHWLRLDHDRIFVKAPLPWEEYLKSQDKQIDIMLAPVAPSRLNDCRAETKRIDIARVGAAALMSDCPAFSPAEEGELLLPYSTFAWTEKLIALIDDITARRIAADATLRRVEKMAQQADLGMSLFR